MKRRSELLPVSAAILAVAISLSLPRTATAANLTVQPAPAPVAGAVPAALASRLDPQGAEVSSGGSPLCNVWVLKSVATVPSTSSEPDILYGNLQVGELVGVMQVLAPAEDFRHQKVQPGVYTLRYGQIPQDGNHMGVSQYRDFLLLGPVAADTKPDAVLGFDDLVALSRKTLTSGHPAVLSLIPANSSVKTPPAVFNDDSGDEVVQFDLPEQGAAKPMALVIVPGAQSGGQ